MRVWRLDRNDRNPLEGLGGLFSAGRWHPRGVRVVYTASHLSLAILEMLVHVDPDLLPDRLAAFEIDIPDGDASREAVPFNRLPTDWRAEPPRAGTQALGRSWLTDPTRPSILVVPSVVVPREVNYLLNPAHPDAGRWSVVASEPFRFDRRLLVRRSAR
jgi:RES domain-containing protein